MQREQAVSIVICSHDPQVIAAADDTIVDPRWAGRIRQTRGLARPSAR